jgi:ribosomal-protein-serine acetyltransferase
MNRLQIRAAVDNTRSRAIPERLRFTFEGVQRQAKLLNDDFQDLAVYSMLAAEWQLKRV